MNYFIFGGAGFVGTHLTKLLKEIHPESMIYNLDIVEPVTQMFTIKGYNAVLKEGEEVTSQYIYCDVRKSIELEFVNVTDEDVVFNFAAVHRTPGHPDQAYFETNIRGAENVCAFAEKFGIKKIVFTSSIWCSGRFENRRDASHTEHTLWNF